MCFIGDGDTLYRGRSAGVVPEGEGWVCPIGEGGGVFHSRGGVCPIVECWGCMIP